MKYLRKSLSGVAATALALGLGTTTAAVGAVSNDHAFAMSTDASDDSPENLLTNASFEEVGSDGVLPAGWERLSKTRPEVAFEVVGDDSSHGDHSVRVRDASSDRGYGLRPSETVPVTGGERYTFALDLKLDGGQLQPMVYFLDADGQPVSRQDKVVEPEPGTWTRESLTVSVPDGAASAYPLIFSSRSATVDGLVDNATLYSDPPAGTEEDLGQPIAGVTNAGAGYTTDASGRPIGVVVATGNPAEFSAVDIETGERLFTQTLSDVGVAWSFVTTDDRQVYIGTSGNGQVWRFDPDELSLTLIAEEPFEQTHLWAGALSADGDPMFGTYPGGTVIEYNRDADTWVDHDMRVDGNIYVRSLATSGGDVYAGGGSAQASITHLDTDSGAMAEIPLPAAYADEHFVHSLAVSGGLLFARLSPSSDLVIYSLADEEWIDTIEDVRYHGASPAVQTNDADGERTEVLITPIDGPAIAYDVQTGEQREVSLNLDRSPRGWSQMQLGLPDFPDDSLVTATSKSVFHAWNPTTGDTRVVQGDATPTPFHIRSMGTGPSGDVYVGALASPPGIAHVDADSGETELLPLNGQVEGITAHDNYLTFGVYTGGKIYSYDTTQPWEAGTNPGAAVEIGHEQDRPVAWTDAGDVVATGSIPDYGTLGGALSLFDPATGDIEVFRNVVQDQSVMALAYRDGKIYGGTGIRGGIGAEPTATEARLFVFDLATREVVLDTVPIPGAPNITGLTFDDDGRLWGLTKGEVFRFDPDEGEVTLRESLFKARDRAMYSKGRELIWHNDRLVGVSAGRLFEIDPATLETTVIQTQVQSLAIDGNGAYYYNRGSTLFRWIPDDAEPPCDEVIKGGHAGPVMVSDGTTCLTDATVEGPVHVQTGANLTVTSSEISGPVTASEAKRVAIRQSQIDGPMSIQDTARSFILSGTTVLGPLACTGNAEGPDDEGEPNTIRGPATGQCAGL